MEGPRCRWNISVHHTHSKKPPILSRVTVLEAGIKSSLGFLEPQSTAGQPNRCQGRTRGDSAHQRLDPRQDLARAEEKPVESACLHPLLAHQKRIYVTPSVIHSKPENWKVTFISHHQIVICLSKSTG